MIKTLRVQNFKAFKDTGELELKPITILAGPNSGGKTSILQSLLLLKQTLESERTICLNLDGRFLQFSGLDEMSFSRPSPEESEVSYEFKLQSPIPREVVSRYFPDFAMPGRIRPESFEFESNVKLSFRQLQPKKGKEIIGPHSFEIKSWLQGTEGPALTIRFYGQRYRVYTGGKGKHNLDERKCKRIVDIDFNNFLPNFFVLRERKGEYAEHFHDTTQLDPIFRLPLTLLREELEANLKYLGPLREEPRRAYLHSGSLFPEIGKKGEYAAQILWIERNEKVKYAAGQTGRIYEMNLLTGVSKAFQDLGILQPISVSQAQRIMYQVLFGLKEASLRKKVTIADVGFGMSQLLPIILMGLRSDQDSILIFEQPEIHLHPKLQANLADFFLILAKSGKRLIVETHSDHLINRLRRRIVEDQSNKIKDMISILFIHPPEEEQGATIEPLSIDRYGIIENWPPDFLPEAADEAEIIFREGLEKRQRQ